MYTCSANALSTHSWPFCPCFRAVSLNMTGRVACRWVSTEASISPMLASVSSADLLADARPSSASCSSSAALSPSLSPFQQQNRGPAMYPEYMSVDPCGFAFKMQISVKVQRTRTLHAALAGQQATLCHGHIQAADKTCAEALPA